MHITIFQIDIDRDNKRVHKGMDSLLYQPYNPKTFSMRNYQIVHINFKFWDIEEKFFESILYQIEHDFKSFYTCEERPQNGIVVGDVVKIGRRIYFFNGESGWKYVGLDKPRRW